MFEGGYSTIVNLLDKIKLSKEPFTQKDMAVLPSDPPINKLDCSAFLQYVSGVQAYSTAVFFNMIERLNVPAMIKRTLAKGAKK